MIQGHFASERTHFVRILFTVISGGLTICGAAFFTGATRSVARQNQTSSDILQLPLRQRIVFASDRFDQGGDIFTAKTDGSDLRRLTANGTPDECPSISPDGMWIAYFSRGKGSFTLGEGPNGATANLTVMRANGDDGHAIAILNDGYSGCPSWSRDSKSLAVIESVRFFNQPVAPPNHIRIFSVNGAQTNTFDAYATRISFSPDGNRLLLSEYQYIAGSVYRIVVTALNGSDRRVLATAGSDLSPAWDPSGAKILYACAGICNINPDGTNQAQITTTYAENPLYSPDGRHIAFTCLSPTPLCIIDSDGRNLVRLGDSRYYAISKWSPDGSTLMYRCAFDVAGLYSSHFHRTQGTQATIQTDICTTRIDGSATSNITRSAALDDTPTFSPGS